MKVLVPILIPLLLVTGCKSKDAIPRNVLPQKKMQAVLWDMMRADQFLTDYVLNRDTSLNKATESFKYYQQIFAIHKINKDEFQESFSFYRSHPSLLKAIMDSISTPPEVVTPPVEPVQVTTPVVIPADAVNKTHPVMRDTLFLRKKRPDNVE